MMLHVLYMRINCTLQHLTSANGFKIQFPSSNQVLTMEIRVHQICNDVHVFEVSVVRRNQNLL
jgi:hypothetical protein